MGTNDNRIGGGRSSCAAALAERMESKRNEWHRQAFLLHLRGSHRFARPTPRWSRFSDVEHYVVFFAAPADSTSAARRVLSAILRAAGMAAAVAAMYVMYTLSAA